MRSLPRFHRLKVLRRLAHPGHGFTQGLITDGSTVWESTGQYGQSSLRRYRLGAERWTAWHAARGAVRRGHLPGR